MRDHQSLAAAAALRGGCFTRTDALEAGWTDQAIGAEVEARRWSRLHPGVFVDRDWFSGLDPRPRHLVDVRARLLARADGWCAARRSAAVVHGLPLLGQLPPRPLLVRDRTVLSDRGFLRQERINTLPPEERTEVHAIAVTTLARTVVDVAREESFRSALVVADAALRAGLCGSELVGVAERCRLWPGAPVVTRVLACADGRAESALESVSRAGFLEVGVPLPEPQVEVWVAGGMLARVDFLWRQHLVIGEADGRAKYATVDDLYAEKRREERLRDLGFEVVRWDWTTAYRAGPDFRDLLLRAFARGDRSSLAAGVRLRSTELPAAA